MLAAIEYQGYDASWASPPLAQTDDSRHVNKGSDWRVRTMYQRIRRVGWHQRRHSGRAASTCATFEHLESRRLLAGDPSLVLSEFMASNADTVSTMLRADVSAEFVGETLTPDWIELHNPTSQTIDAGGLHLTDDPRDLTKWRIPTGTLIPSQGYFVVFASGRDVQDPLLDRQHGLHTNFQLDANGEFLALTSPSGQIIDSYDEYPAQRTHISYGVDDDGASRYFLTPTPGHANIDGATGFVADVQFSVERGFYTDAFQLSLGSNTESAVIRYTTDGSVPSEGNGATYTTPLIIDKTTTVRARAFDDDLLATDTETHSYFFLSDVVEQDSQAALDAGFPDRWGDDRLPDYGLDDPDQFPLIAGDTGRSIDEAKEAIYDSLLSVPSLSIVLDVDDMFGERGIYVNPELRGSEWERPTSVELIHPDQSEGFQIDSGIRVHGGAFRRLDLTKKKSFRLLFKTTYGSPTLNYPVFGPDAANQFDQLVLRMASNDSWQWAGATGQAQYVRDQFLRQTQRAMGQPSPHGTYTHLYINGMYWGLYNVVERPDASFGHAYFGSDPYEWDGQNARTPVNAQGDSFRDYRTRYAWQDLMNLTNWVGMAETEADRTAAYMKAQGLNPDGTENTDLPKFLDPVNYADFMIANYYSGNNDWPWQNYFTGRENSRESDGFKFFVWDAEMTLFLFSNPSTWILNSTAGAASPFADLRASQEFRMLFADRVQKHLFNGGALYVDPSQPQWDPTQPDRNQPATRYAAIANTIDDALLAESARWGDQHRDVPYTRDADWQVEYDRIMTTWFPERSFDLLEIFKEHDLYPTTHTPVYSQRGGTITNATELSLSIDRGTVYYTLDGTDPRAIGGGLSPHAIEYERPFRLSRSATVTVRNLDGDEWSAVDRATFLVDVVPANRDNFRISEVHFNPRAATAEEAAAGFRDKDEFEFIEFTNISNQTIDLSNARLSQITQGADHHGVRFDFAQSDMTQLQAGQHVLIVENLPAFQMRYGSDLPVAGQWIGGLNNTSETLTVMAGDQLLQQFAYRDQWYPSSDGGGTSLEHVDVANADLARWNLAESWRPSPMQDGSPGQPAADVVPGDSNHDGVFDSSDLVAVLHAGEYEDDIVGNSTFEEGDWDGDGDFTSADLVFVLQHGSYQTGSSAVTNRHACWRLDDRKQIFADWPDDALDSKASAYIPPAVPGVGQELL